MWIIGFLIELGILWFIITLFTRSLDSQDSFRDTLVVLFGMIIVRLVLGVLPGFLQVDSPLTFPVIYAISLVALYFLVRWSCDTERKTTLKICGWYIVASLIKNSVFSYLMRSG